MPNFKIVFTSYYNIDGEEQGQGGNYTRTITAANYTDATCVAHAMRGEEVNQSEWLDEVLSVEETEEPPYIASWNSRYSWSRVLKIMEIQESEVSYIYDTYGSIVGFKYH